MGRPRLAQRQVFLRFVYLVGRKAQFFPGFCRVMSSIMTGRVYVIIMTGRVYVIIMTGRVYVIIMTGCVYIIIMTGRVYIIIMTGRVYIIIMTGRVYIIIMTGRVYIIIMTGRVYITRNAPTRRRESFCSKRPIILCVLLWICRFAKREWAILQWIKHNLNKGDIFWRNRMNWTYMLFLVM